MFSSAREGRGRIRLGRAFDAYVAWIRAKGYSEATIKTARNLETALHRLGGLVKTSSLAAITPRVAERVQRELFAHYGAGTAFTYAQKLRKVFRTFAAAGLILANPFAHLVPIRKPDRPLGAVLTESEVRRLLSAPRTNHPSGLRHRAMLELLYSTAIRVSECAGLTIDDLDHDRGTLLVRGGKGAKDRLLPLGKTASTWVRRYVDEVRPRYAGTTLALWVGQGGRPVSGQWIGKAIAKLGRKAGIKKPVTPHTLRRSCATHMLERGATVEHVMKLLGHADAKSLARYLKVTLRELRRTHEETHPREIEDE